MCYIYSGICIILFVRECVCTLASPIRSIPYAREIWSFVLKHDRGAHQEMGKMKHTEQGKKCRTHTHSNYKKKTLLFFLFAADAKLSSTDILCRCKFLAKSLTNLRTRVHRLLIYLHKNAQCSVFSWLISIFLLTTRLKCTHHTRHLHFELKLGRQLAVCPNGTAARLSLVSWWLMAFERLSGLSNENGRTAHLDTRCCRLLLMRMNIICSLLIDNIPFWHVRRTLNTIYLPTMCILF